MVELKTKMTESGILYIPKTIREAFGRHMKIFPTVKAALFCPVDTTYEQALASLKVIEVELRHRLDLQIQSNQQAI